MDIVKKYKELSGNRFTGLGTTPNSHIPRPKQEDYDRGYITRYFVQRVNDRHAPIFEVSASELSRMAQSVMYKTVSLRWRISGPIDRVYDSDGKVIDKGVRESNKISTELNTGKMPNLKLYLPNTIQFYKK